MVHYDSWPDAERINHISPEMVKNAAFHNEGHHPHIHMVAYSTGAEYSLNDPPKMVHRSTNERKSVP